MSIYIQDLPFPPTMNHRLIYFNGMMRKNPEHRVFERELKQMLLLNCYPKDGKELIGKKLSVTIFYEGPESQWFTRKGKIRKVDADNRHKNLLDVIMPFFDLDDSQIFEITIKKLISAQMETTASVLIEEMEG